MSTTADAARPEFSAAELLRWQEAGCLLGSSPSPFYAALFGRFAADCEQGSAPVADLLARAPMTINAAAPLRLFGGVHRGVLVAEFPELAATWPTTEHPAGDVDGAYDLLRTLFASPPASVLDALSRDPQTNEVGRSAALALGLAQIGRLTRKPIRLFEIGSSAGLNLRIDSYFCDGGATTWGSPDAALHFGADCYEKQADFAGATPIIERRGCDINPIDATTDDGAATLMSYVWPDQFARLDRLRRALEIARAVPAGVDVQSADEWVDRRVVTVPDTATVLMHSVMWQYMPDAVQNRITATLAERGAAATDDAPLALVSMEPGPQAIAMDLSVTLWPGGDREVLAHCGGHGPPIEPLE
ncbi:MAG: hypothetical protein QOG65_2810 [Actinomycetota bacterium]|jgi:hypothetical protein|nr:hypothetical protein [Actinomycetota bacterium]